MRYHLKGKRNSEVQPVPEPSLTPPMKWLLSRSWSHTVSSTQVSLRSCGLKPSYTIVWLNRGLAVFFTTLVFCRLLLLISGRTTLQWDGTRTHPGQNKHTVHTLKKCQTKERTRTEETGQNLNQTKPGEGHRSKTETNKKKPVVSVSFLFLHEFCNFSFSFLFQVF